MRCKLETYRISGLRWLAEFEDVAACVYEFHWAGEIGGQVDERRRAR